MAAKNKTHEITIKGIITPVEWDEEDNVTAVALEGDDEVTYHIEPVGQGERLLDHLDAYVKITGSAREAEGESVILVRSFVSLDDDQEEGYDDFDAGWSEDGWDAEEEINRR